MYRLLLVCDKKEICSLYADFKDWEKLGFEKPMIAVNAQSGIDLLSCSRFDAVSWLLSVSEGKRFFAYLSRRPEMLGMETVRDEERLRREISTARRVLSSRDASRRTKQVDDLTRAMQDEFFCDLLRGSVFSKEKIDERMHSLKLADLRADLPVCMSSFRLPQGDYFLAEVWRYGRERLENALKNIFEAGDARMQFVVLIINPHHMRLLGLPRVPMTMEEARCEVAEHLERCRESLEAYFELTLDIKRIVPYESLYALSKENAMRMAH